MFDVLTLRLKIGSMVQWDEHSLWLKILNHDVEHFYSLKIISSNFLAFIQSHSPDLWQPLMCFNCEAWNIYYPALHWKSLPTHNLEGRVSQEALLVPFLPHDLLIKFCVCVCVCVLQLTLVSFSRVFIVNVDLCVCVCVCVFIVNVDVCVCVCVCVCVLQLTLVSFSRVFIVNVDFFFCPRHLWLGEEWWITRERIKLSDLQLHWWRANGYYLGEKTWLKND